MAAAFVFAVLLVIVGSEPPFISTLAADAPDDPGEAADVGPESFRVFIRTPAGGPAPDVHVSVLGIEDSHRRRVLLSDHDGFVTPHVARGMYNIAISEPGYAWAEYGVLADASSPFGVVQVALELRHGVEVHLEVVGQDGSRVPDAHVRIVSDGEGTSMRPDRELLEVFGGGSDWRVFASSKEYVTVVPPGRYRVQIEDAAGFRNEVAELEVRGRGPVRRRLLLRPETSPGH